MRPVPADWADIMRGSHQIATRVESWLFDVSLADDLPVVGGTMTLDGLALVQGTLDITFATEGELVPTSTDAPLAPYGQELYVKAGITSWTGVTGGLLDLGVYRVETVSVRVGPDSLLVRVTGSDRGAAMADARFLDPWVITAGTNVVDAIVAMALDALGTLVIIPVATPFTLPAVVYPEGDNRWQRMNELAASAGLWLHFDGLGRLVIAPVPVVNDVAQAELIDGENGTMTAAEMSLSRVGRPNGIVVLGENPANPNGAVRGVALDTGSGSPTAWGGPYGKVLGDPIRSNLATSVAQATAEAQGRLQQEVGLSSQLTGNAVTNLALEPFDAVQASSDTLGVSELHALDRLQLPLEPEPEMQFTTRVRQVLAA